MPEQHPTFPDGYFSEGHPESEGRANCLGNEHDNKDIGIEPTIKSTRKPGDIFKSEKSDHLRGKAKRKGEKPWRVDRKDIAV